MHNDAGLPCCRLLSDADPIRPVCRFIKQEAEEKSSEIMVAAEEEVGVNRDCVNIYASPSSFVSPALPFPTEAAATPGRRNS